jgi:hypothetical protein
MLFDRDEGFLMFYIDKAYKDCIPLRYIRAGYRVIIGRNAMFLDSGIRVVIKISIS